MPISNHFKSIHTHTQNPEVLLMRHSGGEVSSLDMAQYVFWTGDEEGVARAVEEFIQKGLMSRDNAIKLLREISMGIEYLENSYSNRVAAAASVATKDNDIMQEDSAMVILFVFFFSSMY